MPFQLPPPRDWQHFEDLCWRLWKEIWNDPKAQKNGRQGQAQAGVDVFGRNRDGDWAGVQCKGKDSYTDQKLTPTELKKEVEKAKGFKTSLSEYSIATTAPRDAKIQQLARETSEQHRQQGLFSVHVFGWDDIVDRLSDFSDLYRSYLQNLRLTDLKIGGQRLPRTTGHLFGREAELRSLTGAWEDDGQNVLSIIAWGGVGKTALVKHWMGQMAVEQFRGAERVFTWSFYSQGAKGQAASSDQFIDRALRFFEDPDPAQGGPYEKGERLGALLTRFKALLVLDGLEPLQYPSGPWEGQLKDPALQVLIDRLSLGNQGLCLITTREKVSDIAHLEETTAPAIELEHLSPKAGAVLLDRLGVKGIDEELREASQEFDGHALALTLLGSYLAEFRQGDIRHWREVPLLKGEQEQGEHVIRMMESYKRRLGVGGGKLMRKFRRVLLQLGLRQPSDGEIAWSLLQLMGFFDRPAQGEEIQALLAEPSIQGLSEEILKLDPPTRKRALSRLRRLRLLVEPPPDDPDGMDAHPLLREYLSEQLQQHHAEACREGHHRLYQHLKESAEELPDTLEEMMPLFHAVVHGCRAGLHQETLTKVYWKRIHRGKHFAAKKLGSMGFDLAALVSFFESFEDLTTCNLNKDARSFLLNEVGFRLRSLGRLSEAKVFFGAGLEADQAREDWDRAAKAANNLSEVLLSLGDIVQAVEVALKGVQLADQTNNNSWKLYLRTCLADAYHQSGRPEKAEVLFEEASQMQTVDHELLFSLQGFQYCDLLLAKCEPAAWSLVRSESRTGATTGVAARCQDVREKATLVLEASKASVGNGLGRHDVALTHLTIGRTFLLEVVLSDVSQCLLPSAQDHLDRAVTGFREAVVHEFITRGLIARAQLHRVQFQNSGDESFAQQAQQDLDEASRIAYRGPMPLFQADIHLEHSRLHHAQGNLDQAHQSLSKARDLIQKHGYHRRDAELEAMEKELGE